MVGAALSKSDTMRWGIFFQRIHVTLIEYRQPLRIRFSNSVNTIFGRIKGPILRRVYIVENIVIGNATYLIGRNFVGSKDVSELIQERMVAKKSQVLPLTNEVSPSYNEVGRNAGLRRNHAN